RPTRTANARTSAPSPAARRPSSMSVKFNTSNATKACFEQKNRRNPPVFSRLNMPRLLLFVPVAHHVQTHEVRRAGERARTAHNAEHLTLLYQPTLLQDHLCHVDKHVRVVEAVAENRLSAPQQHRAVHHALKRAQRVD